MFICFVSLMIDYGQFFKENITEHKEIQNDSQNELLTDYRYHHKKKETDQTV